VSTAEPSYHPGMKDAHSWQGWGWVAAGIIVLSLLALLLRDSVKRKQTAR
jgi:hypothetical protein